jgi:hypothetical protein
MYRYQLIIAGRALLGALLNLLGLLNVRVNIPRTPRRKRIAFEAYSVHLAQCFVPIINRLREKVPEFEIDFLILPHPHFSFRSLWALRNFARESLKIPGRNVRFFWQVLWQKYDLLVCTDVYARFPLRHTKRVLLKHGAGVASRILKWHPWRKTIFDFDLVLVNGEADLDLLRPFCPEDFIDEKVIAAGLPYLDRLFTQVGSRDDYLRHLGLGVHKQVVLVAPSWRGLEAIEARQPSYFETLIAALEKLDVQILIKMHACTFNKVMVQGEDWAQRVRCYARGLIGIDYEVDDIPALQHANVLITDISSRAFNFMLLDKPVVVMCPDDVFVEQLDRERLELMRQGAYLARSVAEVSALLTHCQPAHDEMSSARLRLARYCFANPGRATEAVVAHLLRQVRTESDTWENR